MPNVRIACGYGGTSDDSDGVNVAIGVTAAEYLRFVGATTRFALEPHALPR
jgi:hypothetical protein